MTPATQALSVTDSSSLSARQNIAPMFAAITASEVRGTSGNTYLILDAWHRYATDDYSHEMLDELGTLDTWGAQVWSDWMTSQPQMMRALLGMIERDDSPRWVTRRMHKALGLTAEILAEIEAETMTDEDGERRDRLAAQRDRVQAKADRSGRKPEPRPVADTDDAVRSAVIEMVRHNPGWTAKIYADAIEGPHPKRVLRVIGELEKTQLRSVKVQDDGRKGYHKLFLKRAFYQGRDWTTRELADHDDNVHGFGKTTIGTRLNLGWSVEDVFRIPPSDKAFASRKTASEDLF